MRVAFWTASAFARPLHALQRWWHVPTVSVTHRLSTNKGAVLSLKLDNSHIAASSSNTNESINVPVDRLRWHPSAFSLPAAW